MNIKDSDVEEEQYTERKRTGRGRKEDVFFYRQIHQTDQSPQKRVKVKASKGLKY